MPKNEMVKNLRECLRFYGDLQAEIIRVEERRREIQRQLEDRRVIWQDTMTGYRDVSWGDIGEKVRRELNDTKIALHDAGPDCVHQCSPNARGFTILKPGEKCGACGFEQPAILDPAAS